MTDLLARERLAAKRLLDARRAQLANATILDGFMLRYAHDLAASQPRCDYTIQQLPTLAAPLSTDLVPVFHNGQTYQTTAGALSAVPALQNTIPVFNAVAYGAKGDGVHDDTTAIQNAATAAYNASGVLYLPAGTYLVSVSGTLLGVAYSILLPGPIPIVGAGATITTVKVSNNAITSTYTQYMMFTTNSAFTSGAWALQDFTIDGNGTAQNFVNFTSQTYFGVLDLINQSNTIDSTMRIERMAFKNWSMLGTNTIAHGTALNTYGFARQTITDCYFFNCDYGVFVTQPNLSNSNSTDIFACKFHNTNNIGVYNEGFSDCNIYGCHFYNDSLPTGASGQTAVVGIGLLAQQVVRNFQVRGCSFLNLDYPTLLGLSGGNITKNSLLTDCSAYNCRGGFVVQYFDQTSLIANIVAEKCGLGGITGTTVYGAFELNAGALGLTVASNLTAINSGTAGISLLGKTQITGGYVSGNTGGNVTFNDQAHSVIRAVNGYNPTGIQVAPAFPTSGTVFTNPFGSDMQVLIITGATTTVSSISVGGNATSVTMPASSVVSISVPAGQTITITYSGANIGWTWNGN